MLAFSILCKNNVFTDEGVVFIDSKSILAFSDHYFKYILLISSLFSLSSSAYDVVLRQKVAVKKLSRPFQSLIHCRRSYRELRLLKHMKHENVRARRTECSQTDRQTLLLIVFPRLCRSSGCWTSSHLLRRWRTSASCKFSSSAAQLCISYSRCRYPSKGGGGGDPGGKHAFKCLAVAMAAPVCSPLKAPPSPP